MNGVYLREMDKEVWLEAATPWIARAAALGAEAEGGAVVVPEADPADADVPMGEEDADGAFAAAVAAIQADIQEDPATYAKIYPLIIERLERLEQIPDKIAYLFWGANVQLDEKSVKKVLLKEGARAEEALRACRDVLAREDLPWEAEPLQEACRALCEPLSMKPKLLFQPLRVAVAGNMVSPPLFESIELMDPEDVLARIDSTLETVFGDRE